MKNTPHIKGLQSALQALESPAVDLEYVAAPHTTISGRSQMVDLSKDGKPRFGVERVQIQDMVQLASESGPNGEAVHKPVNDWEDSVRLIGDWTPLLDGAGQAALSVVVGDSVEITFYGTGLNCLMLTNDSVDRGFDIEIDGVASGSVNTVGSNVLGGRNYSPNLVYPIASGLSLGLHTIRLTKTTAFSSRVCGYEILNERSDVLVPAFTTGDGQKHPETTLALAAPGSKGGRALIYADASGVQQASQATDAAALYLAAADHSNESVIAEHFWREFGAGRGDDFSTITGVGGDRAFTLDDGTTTLVADDPEASAILSGGYSDVLEHDSDGDSITLTFVGTGLDALIRLKSAAGSDDYSVFVDGVDVGNISDNSGGVEIKLEKIASGLPYGTHTVKIDRTSASSYNFGVIKYVVYGPKKPSLPKDAVELGEYFVMADFVAAPSSAVSYTPNGVLRKTNIREMIYSGTWSAISSPNVAFDSGFNVNTNASTSYVEYSFFGTGVNFAAKTANGETVDHDITVDGLALNTGSNATGTLASQITGSSGITIGADGSVTGVVSGNGSYHVSLSGLAIGLHTIRITNNVGTGSIYMDAFDIITPIHAPKLNGPFVKQNTLRVGSESIGDLRKPSSDKKNVSKASGVTSSPTTTSSTYSPIPDAAASIETSGGDLAIDFEAIFTQSVSNAGRRFQIYLDGKLISYEYDDVDDVTNVTPGNSRIIIPVAPGIHYVHVMYAANAGTLTAYQTRRTLTLSEIKK